MGPRKRKREFEVALSFAGENRDQVGPIADALKAKGVAVFYDKDHRARLWGKDQAVYAHIYGAGSGYVIPFVSEHYVREDWPRHEFELARREAMNRKHEFLLPIRLDDSPLLGLHEDVNYLDLREMSSEDVVQAILEKLGKGSGSGGRHPSGKGGRRQGKRIGLLAGGTRRALGIIASSILPLGLRVYKELFPETNWSREVRLLSRKGLLTRRNGGLTASPAAKRALLSAPEEAREFGEDWVQALDAFAGHPDTSVLLATHQVRLGRLDDAISTLADVVERGDLGHWSDTYATVLGTLGERRALRRLKVESRIRLLNALSICLSHAGRHEEAIRGFARLRRLSIREGHAWGRGQSYINCGVACHKAGDDRAAARWYRKAVEYAKASGDGVLLGRSLGNLAQMMMEDQPAEAESLIKASIRAKKAADDHAGLVAAHGLLGNLAVTRGEFAEAAKWYRRAASEAKSLGLRYDQALFLHNLGSSYYDLGWCRRALSRFRQSAEIAEADGYQEALLLAGRGQARSEFELGLFPEAERSFRRLCDLERNRGHHQAAMICLHDIGACLLKQGKWLEARRKLDATLRIARRLRDEEWTVTCIRDRCLAIAKGAWGRTGISALRRAARRERGRGNRAVAARLWGIVASELRASGRGAELVQAALRNAERCFDRVKGHHGDKAKLYANLYCVRWERGDYEGGLAVLARMARVADEGGLLPEGFRTANQTGVCLAELGRLEEAEAWLRKARRLAKRWGDEDCLQDAASNLGEILRRRGRYAHAIRLLEGAEAIARKRSDAEGEIGIAHNRSLALQDQGNVQSAERLLGACRDRARRRGLWRENVRALEGLANLSCVQGDANTGRRYSHALEEAKDHGIREAQAEIALNYAAWLNSQGRSKEALRLLRPYEADWGRRIDAHIFYRLLAELRDAVGRPRSAVEAWTRAKQAAKNVGDREAYALCAAALAETYEKLGERGLSDAELRGAIRHADVPERRALLMLQRIRLLLGVNKERAVEKLYVEAKALIKEHGLVGVDVDLHVALGDYEWETPRGDRANGMKAYIAAMLASLEISEEACGEVGGHIVRQVISARSRLTEEKLGRIERDLTKWLREQAGSTGEVVSWALWPLRIGRRARRAVAEGEGMEAALQRVFAEEAPV